MEGSLQIQDLDYEVAPFSVSGADVGAIVRSVESSGQPEQWNVLAYDVM
ncbi:MULTISPECIES: hypothetical protein [Lysobacter]|uniref:Uncharacterized protein n=1 Tax=Lysobacter antibioticus TaxID=84531 RepID=A0A0S2FFH2_LYSAN|nr:MULTISPECIES: hypothetical protein [Lysobacter]ALN65610.1 hypothetical protein GLA29479_4781 [Lysobacter antibioticus]ALN82242.1 hypothetical protein LA76x_4126 [Lysobacter antibioticus]